MLHVLHKLPHDRRRKAYHLSQMIKRSFLSSCQFAVVQRCPVSRALYRSLNLHPTTTLFPKVSRGPIVAHSLLLEFKTPHISKFSWPCVKQKINKVEHFMITVLRMQRTFTNELFMLSSLLGLRHPFPCSQVFCSILSFNFWLHKGRFRPGLGSNYHALQGQAAILNLSKY